MLDIEHGTRRVYDSPKPGHLLRTPAVSPDGRRIIFQVYRDGAWMLELWDDSMRKVLSDPSAEEYTAGRPTAAASSFTAADRVSWVCG